MSSSFRRPRVISSRLTTATTAVLLHAQKVATRSSLESPSRKETLAHRLSLGATCSGPPQPFARQRDPPPVHLQVDLDDGRSTPAATHPRRTLERTTFTHEEHHDLFNTSASLPSVSSILLCLPLLCSSSPRRLEPAAAEAPSPGPPRPLGGVDLVNRRRPESTPTQPVHPLRPLQHHRSISEQLCIQLHTLHLRVSPSIVSPSPTAPQPSVSAQPLSNDTGQALPLPLPPPPPPFFSASAAVSEHVPQIWQSSGRVQSPLSTMNHRLIPFICFPPCDLLRNVALLQSSGDAKTSIGQTTNTRTNALVALDLTKNWSISNPPLSLVKPANDDNYDPPKTSLGGMFSSSDGRSLF